MKLFKISTFLILSFAFLGGFMPELSAKHHRHKRTSVSFNLNVVPQVAALFGYNYTSVPVATYAEPETVYYYVPETTTYYYDTTPEYTYTYYPATTYYYYSY